MTPNAAEPSKPLIIALPIRIQGPRQPLMMAATENEEEDSEEEQQTEQRLVPRTYIPNREPRYSGQQQENNQPNRQTGFLTWNPGNKFMVLQINDFIGVKNAESEESEENERNEEPPILSKPQRNWGFQGPYNLEEARYPNSDNNDDFKNVRSPNKKKRKNFVNHSVEDHERDVYGTDPVVHFLRNKNKKKISQFEFPEIPEEDDEYGIQDWWRY